MEMEAGVLRDVEFSADVVWGLISNFGNRDWSPTIEKVVVDGEGVGAVRWMYSAGSDKPCAERLEAFDNDDMSMSYSIVENSPLPLDDFLGTVKVSATGDNSCRVDWKAEGTAKGMSEGEVTELMQTIYNGIITAVETHLAQ